MARKVVNRKELRAQAEAAEARGKTAKKAEKPAKEKKEKAVKEARMKAYWGVFNPAMKRLAMFEYADKKAAEKKAAELGATHFIQLVKEPIAE